MVMVQRNIRFGVLNPLALIHNIYMKVKKIINTVALTMLLLAGSAAAQTTTPATTPNTPNTGSGGNAPGNIVLLTGSALVALGGIIALSRRRSV